jgi:hypothetical protein
LKGLFEREELDVDDLLVSLIFAFETVSISIGFGAGNEHAAGF